MLVATEGATHVEPGQDGTIPADPDGVAAGHTGMANTFEPGEGEPEQVED